jgi:hypothetical protein
MGVANGVIIIFCYERSLKRCCMCYRSANLHRSEVPNESVPFTALII